MSTPAHPWPNGGPRTDAGRARSSQNAITHGLFAASDFAPVGNLELTLVHELRRCGQIEEGFAGLRKLQTERQLRNESFDAGTDLSHFGLCDWSTPIHPPAQPCSFCKTPRNAECPCKSGLKYKRCCGKKAPPMLHAA